MTQKPRKGDLMEKKKENKFHEGCMPPYPLINLRLRRDAHLGKRSVFIQIRA